LLVGFDAAKEGVAAVSAATVVIETGSGTNFPSDPRETTIGRFEKRMIVLIERVSIMV